MIVPNLFFYDVFLCSKWVYLNVGIFTFIRYIKFSSDEEYSALSVFRYWPIALPCRCLNVSRRFKEKDSKRRTVKRRPYSILKLIVLIVFLVVLMILSPVFYVFKTSKGVWFWNVVGRFTTAYFSLKR
jgi:hypothetical protein